ncbi:MAG: hypothetical protein OHK0017_00540 [Patescibacteria group bacterium]
MIKTTTGIFFLVFLIYSVFACIFGFPLGGWGGLAVIFVVIPYYLLYNLIVAIDAVVKGLKKEHFIQISPKRLFTFLLLIVVLHGVIYITAPSGCGDASGNYTQLQYLRGKGGCGTDPNYFPKDEYNYSVASGEVVLFMPASLILAITLIVFCGQFQKVKQKE